MEGRNFNLFGSSCIVGKHVFGSSNAADETLHVIDIGICTVIPILLELAGEDHLCMYVCQFGALKIMLTCVDSVGYCEVDVDGPDTWCLATHGVTNIFPRRPILVL